MTVRMDMTVANGTQQALPAGSVHLFASRDGLKDLIEDLQRIADGYPEDDHFHYFSEEWGGYDLTIEARDGATPVHHFKVTVVEQ